MLIASMPVEALGPILILERKRIGKRWNDYPTVIGAFPLPDFLILLKRAKI